MLTRLLSSLKLLSGGGQRRACIMAAALCLLLLPACRQRHHTVTRGFYYWRTNYAPGAYEQNTLRALHCRQLFLHCFDVDWDAVAGKAKPLAVVRFLQAPDPALSYVPVIFITRQVVAGIRPQQVPELAGNMARLLAQLLGGRQVIVQQVQIDCDWTAATRERYFALLEALKAQPFFRGKTISCTIRLHQVKYLLRSGIPPADRGLLMCYNLGDLRRPGAHNSILDARLVKDYLKRVKDYPLPLDVALPLFRWCVQFRNGRMLGILRDVPPEDVAAAPFFQHYRASLYHCRADTVWHGYSFRRGDELRAELPATEDIRAVADYTAREVANDSLSVIFFHADPVTLSRYSHDELETIYHTYD